MTSTVSATRERHWNPGMVRQAVRSIARFLLLLLLLSAGATPSSSSSSSSHQYVSSSSCPEVVILEPKPFQQFENDAAVRLRAAVVHANSSLSRCSAGTWALSLTLDDEESMIHEDLALDGLLPSLPTGSHSLLISLVDLQRHGEAVGPRARVTILVGTHIETEVEILLPLAQISKRSQASQAISLGVRARRKESKDVFLRVWIDGEALHVDRPIMVDKDVWEWHRNVSGLKDGLHTMDVHLADEEGSVVSKDRRYFQVLTEDQLHPSTGPLQSLLA
eukprot:754333-Hanusia_phi.AAC.6